MHCINTIQDWGQKAPPNSFSPVASTNVGNLAQKSF